VPALVDTNILVYRVDPRDPAKQRVATRTLRAGIESGELLIAHQSVVEFFAAVTRPIAGGPPLRSAADATRDVEELLLQFDVLYPNDQVIRLALRGAATYQLSWFDAHIWAYAEHYGFDTLLSEDFQHNRNYGTVRVVDPFTQGGAMPARPDSS
jgi:predicted nucleic acid-binding protein